MTTTSHLPPKNLWLSLPALTADEAEQLMNLVDSLQKLLWEAYGDDVLDNVADHYEPDLPADPTDDDIDF